jgi:GGDEF domain-containing protein
MNFYTYFDSNGAKSSGAFVSLIFHRTRTPYREFQKMKTTNLQLSQIYQFSPEPNVVKYFRLYRENRQAILDLIAILVLSTFTYILLAAINFTEMFYNFTRVYEKYNLDEVVILTLIVLAIYLPIFAVRRWRESVQRLRLANTDSLTGLFNRRKGVDTLELEIARAHRYHRPLSVILFDIDHFKAINDLHGHLVGDQVLRIIAKTALEKLRNVDITVRWGGEDF